MSFADTAAGGIEHRSQSVVRHRTQSPEWWDKPRELSSAALCVVSVAGVVLTGVAVTHGLMAGAAAVIAVAAAIAVLRRPWLGGLAVAGLVPIVSGLARGVPVPGLRLSEVVAGGSALLVLVPAKRTEVPRWQAFDKVFFAYAVATVVLPLGHLVIRHQPIGLGDMGSMLLSMQFFLIYRTVRVALPKASQQRMGARLLLSGSVVVSLIAVVQELNIGPARSLVQRFTQADVLGDQSYEAFARATGPFQHWHPLAGYLTVIIVLSISLLLDADQKVMSRLGLVTVLASSVAALMLSVTFIAMLAVVIAAGILGYWYGRLRHMTKWAAGGAVLAVLATGTYVLARVRAQYVDNSSLVPQTIETRLNVWTNEYIPGLAGHWASGYGPGLPPAVVWTHTESLYVTLALRGGIPLLFVFMLAMLALSSGARRIACESVRRPLARAVAALVAVGWLMNLLYPYLTSSGLPQPLFVLIGLTFAGRDLAGRSAQAVACDTKATDGHAGAVQ